METFTLDPRCWRIGRIFGRNPLIRRADRIGALVMLVTLAVSLVAIPVIGVVGAVVYGARDSRYAQEARERHTVVATVPRLRLMARARLSYKRGGQSRLASALAHFNSPRKRKWVSAPRFGWRRVAIQ